jgi:hypothetical protein
MDLIFKILIKHNGYLNILKHNQTFLQNIFYYLYNCIFILIISCPFFINDHLLFKLNLIKSPYRFHEINIFCLFILL